MIISKASKDNGLYIFQTSIRKNIPVIFPTDTIYGIGAALSSIEANHKIYKIKNRPLNMPFPIIAGDLNQVEKIANLSNLSNEAKNYIDKWPAPITLILPSNKYINSLYCKNNTVAIRIPNEKWLQDTLITLGEPVTATSVNETKNPHALNIEDAINNFSNKIDLFLWKNISINTSSEIYDLTDCNIKKLR